MKNLQNKIESINIRLETKIQSIEMSASISETELHQKVDSLEENSNIEVVAVGIGHDVTRYYKKAIKITDVQELGDVMVNQLTDLFSSNKTIH